MSTSRREWIVAVLFGFIKTGIFVGLVSIATRRIHLEPAASQFELSWFEVLVDGPAWVLKALVIIVGGWRTAGATSRGKIAAAATVGLLLSVFYTLERAWRASSGFVDMGSVAEDAATLCALTTVGGIIERAWRDSLKKKGRRSIIFFICTIVFVSLLVFQNRGPESFMCRQLETRVYALGDEIGQLLQESHDHCRRLELNMQLTEDECTYTCGIISAWSYRSDILWCQHYIKTKDLENLSRLLKKHDDTLSVFKGRDCEFRDRQFQKPYFNMGCGAC